MKLFILSNIFFVLLFNFCYAQEMNISMGPGFGLSHNNIDSSEFPHALFDIQYLKQSSFYNAFTNWFSISLLINNDEQYFAHFNLGLYYIFKLGLGYSYLYDKELSKHQYWNIHAGLPFSLLDRYQDSYSWVIDHLYLPHAELYCKIVFDSFERIISNEYGLILRVYIF